MLKFNADDYSDPLIKKYQNKVRELQKDPRFRSRIKVKLAANLDYPDRSFDLVLSALAVPMYCRSPAEAEASIRQMIRVARQMVVFYTPGFQKDFEDNETPIGFSTGRKFHLKFALKSLLQNLETTGLIKFYFNQPSWAEKDAIVIKIFI